MASTLTASFSNTLGLTVLNPVGLNTSGVQDSITHTIRVNITNGTTAGKCDLYYHDSATIANGVTRSIDLTGSLTNALGIALNCVKVRAFRIYNKSVLVGDKITVGGGANPWVGPFGAAGTCDVMAGGYMDFVAPNDGWAVVAGTGDILKLLGTTAGAAIPYEIVILGTSA